MRRVAADAHGQMWTYDGQAIATPTFLLGTGPAGNLVSTVVDLGRFVSFLFARGRSAETTVLKPESLRMMIEPPPGQPGTTSVSVSALHSRNLRANEGPAIAAPFMALPLTSRRCSTPSWAWR